MLSSRSIRLAFSLDLSRNPLSNPRNANHERSPTLNLVLGILAGYILFKNREHKINSYIVCIGWVSTISLALTILMWTQKWNQGEPWTTLSSSLYASLHRIGWALVLFWITFACSTNHGGDYRTSLLLSHRLVAQVQSSNQTFTISSQASLTRF